MRTSLRFKWKYPSLAAWIQHRVQTIAMRPRVWNAFLKYSELSPLGAAWALTHSPYPCVEYASLKDALGEFRGAEDEDEILLHTGLCDRFYKDIRDPRMHLLMEATVLHEMVHWGDWKDGKDHPKEEGLEFEKEAYGKVINPYW